MYYAKVKQMIGSVVLLAIAGLALQPSIALASDEPELPAECSSIQVEAGNKVSFHVYARGVQIYRWNGSSWVFVAPLATLFAEKNYFGEVGTHYVGPKWESKSGSKVEGRRVPGTGCQPDPTAIPWLLLSRFDSTGPGIFGAVTFIQRVNTTGGNAPTEPGAYLDEVKEVPYTAEYYFYRAQN
jgi:Protein of unknown function (DUF3455).